MRALGFEYEGLMEKLELRRLMKILMMRLGEVGKLEVTPLLLDPQRQPPPATAPR